LGLHEAITERILGTAMKVHTALGAGCLESTYDACLRYQLAKDGLEFRHQIRLPIVYQGVQLESAYRIDFIVEAMSWWSSKPSRNCSHCTWRKC
jgi:GxxExxY protein